MTMTPKDCKEQLLSLAELMDKLPEETQVISAEVSDMRFPDSAYMHNVHLYVGIQATATAFGVGLTEEQTCPGYPYDPMTRRSFLAGCAYIYQFDRIGEEPR